MNLGDSNAEVEPYCPRNIVNKNQCSHTSSHQSIVRTSVRLQPCRSGGTSKTADDQDWKTETAVWSETVWWYIVRLCTCSVSIWKFWYAHNNVCCLFKWVWKSHGCELSAYKYRFQTSTILFCNVATVWCLRSFTSSFPMNFRYYHTLYQVAPAVSDCVFKERVCGVQQIIEAVWWC